MNQNEEMKSAQKSQTSKNIDSDQKNHIRYITLDDDNEMNDTPSKKMFQPRLEESSYLPMNVKPDVMEKKKVVKKVRFYDDDAIDNSDENFAQVQEPLPKVGTKRQLTKNDKFEEDLHQDNSHSQNFNEEAAAQAVE